MLKQEQKYGVNSGLLNTQRGITPKILLSELSHFV
jgi:hypothetical protein